MSGIKDPELAALLTKLSALAEEARALALKVNAPHPRWRVNTIIYDAAEQAGAAAAGVPVRDAKTKR
jgi:hypothetical protein